VDLVALSEVRWGYFRTRKQFLLSRFPKRWRVFFAQPPGSGGDDPWTPQRERNVTTFTVPFLKPATTNPLYNAVTATGWGRGAIERIAEAALRRSLRDLGVEPDPVLLVSNVYAARALERLPHRLAVYDFNDSPFQFAGSPAWARDYWRRALARVDGVFAVSEHYRAEVAAQTDRPVIALGNGVEFARFAEPVPVPASFASLPRPRIGYLGLLSHFLDFEALEALRRARRGGTLVLMGPRTPATDAAVDALGRREGVAIMGSVRYEDVPAAMQALDVGVIPFQANHPYVRGINPNKTYQYLAAGLPVVTTPLLDLQPSPPHLQFASDAPGMVRAVERALDAARDPDACRALARPFDWGALADRMVSEIERLLAARAARA
jgi:UDP-galactopyranose mutase